MFNASKGFFSAAVAATPVEVKGARGVIAALALLNLNAAKAYLQCFDSATAPTVGSTAPTFVIPIGASASESIPIPVPLAFYNGLYIAATTTPTGNTAASVDVFAAIE